MSDIYIVLVYLATFFAGLAEPFAFTLGYVWVDMSYPQLLSSYLAGKPVALVMGGAAILAYLVADRRSPPRINVLGGLTIIMAAWVTLTCTWAVAPQDLVWDKWNWAFKTMLFSVFIPYAIRSRQQIEAFLQVVLFSCALHVAPGAVKTLLGSGGYSRAFGVIRLNSGLFESSTIAAVAIMMIPLLRYFKKHSVLLPESKFRSLLYNGYAVLCVVGAVGTFARTALFGFGVLGIGALVQARRKAAALLLIGAGTLGAIYLGPAAWQTRMQTVDSYTEDTSAMGRILVWEWTLGFVSEHPFGGGFSSHVVSEIVFPGSGAKVRGKAFHNSYMEVLGEHGYVGLAIFLGLLVMAIRNLRRVRVEARSIEGLKWCYDLSGALLISLFSLIVCASFVGIAFQPMFWYLFAASVCLREHVFRYSRVNVTVGHRLLTTLPLAPSFSAPRHRP